MNDEITIRDYANLCKSLRLDAFHLGLEEWENQGVEGVKAAVEFVRKTWEQA